MAKPGKKVSRNPKYKRSLSRKQIKTMKKRGYDAERELVSMLRDKGFQALRVPVSAPSKEPFPDVFAVKEDTIAAFEVKSMERYAYYKKDQITKLHEFLQIHRIYPNRYAVIAGKFKYKGWYFEIADEEDNYTLKTGIGMSFDELTTKLFETNRETKSFRVKSC